MLYDLATLTDEIENPPTLKLPKGSQLTTSDKEFREGNMRMPMYPCLIAKRRAMIGQPRKDNPPIYLISPNTLERLSLDGLVQKNSYKNGLTLDDLRFEFVPRLGICFAKNRRDWVTYRPVVGL